jgi:hypothetical protein
VLILQIFLMLASLYMETNLMNNMGGNLLSANLDNHCHPFNKECFLECLYLSCIYSMPESCCQVISISVQSSPYIELWIWSLVILMGLHPLQPVPQGLILQLIQNHCHDVNVIIVASAFGSFSWSLIHTWDSSLVVNTLYNLTCWLLQSCRIP